MFNASISKRSIVYCWKYWLYTHFILTFSGHYIIRLNAPSAQLINNCAFFEYINPSSTYTKHLSPLIQLDLVLIFRIRHQLNTYHLRIHTDYNKLWKLIKSTLEGAYFMHSLHILIDQKWHGTLFLSFFSIKIAFTWAKTFHYFFSYIDRIEFVQLRFISIEMSLFLSLCPSLFSTIHSTDAS